MLGSLHEERLNSLVQRGRELAEFLQDVRAGHLRTETAYEGTDSCRFCYTWADRRPGAAADARPAGGDPAGACFILNFPVAAAEQ